MVRVSAGARQRAGQERRRSTTFRPCRPGERLRGRGERGRADPAPLFGHGVARARHARGEEQGPYRAGGGEVAAMIRTAIGQLTPSAADKGPIGFVGALARALNVRTVRPRARASGAASSLDLLGRLGLWRRAGPHRLVGAPRPGAQRTDSTPRAPGIGAASPLDPSRPPGAGRRAGHASASLAPSPLDPSRPPGVLAAAAGGRA